MENGVSMSQHHFYTMHNNEISHVLLGWDRPLNGFFMVIEKPSDKGDKPFWSNLDKSDWDDVAHPNNLSEFLVVLSNLSISIPQQMHNELLQDQLENMGNKEIVHCIKNGIYQRHKYEHQLDYCPEYVSVE